MEIVHGDKGYTCVWGSIDPEGPEPDPRSKHAFPLKCLKNHDFGFTFATQSPTPLYIIFPVSSVVIFIIFILILSKGKPAPVTAKVAKLTALNHKS